MKRAADAARDRGNARVEQREIVQRYVHQHRKNLLALLRTPHGEIRAFPEMSARMERGQDFELRPIHGVSAFIEQAAGRHDKAAAHEVVVVVAGPDFRWRSALPALPGAHGQMLGVPQQFSAAVTTAGRSRAVPSAEVATTTSATTLRE